MKSIYDLDHCIKRIAGGQGPTRGLWAMLHKLFKDDEKKVHPVSTYVILEYVERQVYEDA